MAPRAMRIVSVPLVLWVLAASLGPQPAMANGLEFAGMLGGAGGLINMIPNTLNSATSMVNGLTSPLMGALSPMTGGLSTGLNGMLSSTLGGIGTLTGGQTGLVGNTMRLATGSVSGLTTGMSNALGGLATANGAMSSAGAPVVVTSPNGLGGNVVTAVHPGLAAAEASSRAAAIAGASQLIKNRLKRQAIPEGAMMAGAAMGAATGAALNGAAMGSLTGGPINGQSGEMMAAASLGAATGSLARAANEMMPGVSFRGAAGSLGHTANDMMVGATLGAVNGALAGAASESAAIDTGAGEAGLLAGSATGTLAAGAASHSAAVNSAVAANVLVGPTTSLVGRQALAAEAVRNAQAESAAAGAEMVQNGAINARSASLASNAYRQAKLASARDRVNIAGTIQNSARISDAAIATHDTATKAEDSLLGSELAVDSAATVFDSDGAYIPPVTASLLRSLPYGRLGLRNIVPKPLTHPSVMLPDVWLNGVPVNYQNIPLRMLPYGIGPAQSVNSLLLSQAAAGNGAIVNGQPFIANNGMVLNGLVFDPAYAYLTGANINGVIGSSLMPILANGQLEAQDELAMANLLNMQQLNGVGMSSTYQGYGRLNPVPMITGSVSDINLMPTTTIGTTYPIGSALVIEPRDSYFQDYTDNASSRQNFDERQQ